MGERCKIAVFDLDGTLIKGSSFNRFIWFILKKLFKSGHLWLGIIVVYNSIFQAFRLKTRAYAKYKIMQVADGVCSSDDYYEFAITIVKRMRSDLLGQLYDLQHNNIHIVLLSASPDQYVKQIAANLNFDYVAGTYSANTWGKYYETRGERKLQILKTLLPENSVIDSVFTDHHDDFMLIDFCKGAKVYLINPSKKLKSLCDSYKIDYKINIQHD